MIFNVNDINIHHNLNNYNKDKLHVSLRLNPTTGFNPIVGFTSIYWMQKHPLVGCRYPHCPIADTRSHWEVALNSKPIKNTITKYFNEKSHQNIILAKNTARFYYHVCITTKHPLVGCFFLWVQNKVNVWKLLIINFYNI